ncbi:MAG: hypothetical protein IT158_16635 [Bryobacterales bacterium]|nr:hypothetical protein [Bryobacterales bacterium]
MPRLLPSLLRWIARFSAILLAVAFLLFATFGVLLPHQGPAGREWLAISFFGAACLLPLLSWRWELPGAVLSLLCLLTWALLAGQVRQLFALIVGLPGVLFLASWISHRVRERSDPARQADAADT